MLPNPGSACGVSGDHTWHRVGDRQVALRRRISGPRSSRDQWHRVSLRLTDKGHEVLAQNPFEALVQAIESLDASEQTTLHHSLDRVLAAISTTSASRSFGVCRDCTFLIEDKDSAIAGTFLQAAPGRECRLRGMAIQPEDFDLLCIDFLPSERMSLS
jgi:hypothetical protein